MGSEMCIRDRAGESEHLRLRRAVDVGVEDADTGAFLDQRQGQVCLLYTSDAADERSSVDLGGRRIIKKKKRRKYNRRLHQGNTIAAIR